MFNKTAFLSIFSAPNAFFYLITIYREKVHESIRRRLEKALLKFLKITH